VAELSAAQRKVARALREMKAMALLALAIPRHSRDQVDADLETVNRLKVREARIVEQELEVISGTGASPCRR
jgi:hypothetical protein